MVLGTRNTLALASSLQPLQEPHICGDVSEALGSADVETRVDGVPAPNQPKLLAFALAGHFADELKKGDPPRQACAIL